ncbi:MAG: GNAT family N-acetyltransferase [Acidimicrobiia bacterium]|nr:GNAT family N-acetyltransferase [Acidimicrobiia bacterium]
MARSRLAVALMVPEPHRTEIDGLRRAVGGDLARIEPHITLVPPVNVRDEAMGEALSILRDAAAAQEGPLDLTIGPAASFAPTNRVLYLRVDGSPIVLSALERLRASVLQGVLRRDEQRAFVPHVTLTNRLGGHGSPSGEGTTESDDDISIVAHAVSLLGHYQVSARFERLDLLCYGLEDRRWTTVADASLEPRRIVGRGGLPVELTASTVVDPETLDFVGSLPEHERPSQPLDASGSRVVVTARRAGQVVGVALARAAGRSGVLDHVVVAPGERRTGVGAHLLATVQLEMARLGARTASTARPVDGVARHLLDAHGWRAVGDATLTTTLNV